MLPNSRKARELARARREMAKEEAADMVPVPESESDEQQDEEEEGVYEVERIVDHRMSRRYPGTKEYLIKWKNYDEDSNTWENEKNVFSEELMKKYWDEKNKERKDKKRSTALSSSSMKKKKKQARDNDTKVEVSIHPPSGLEWEDAKRVVHIFADKTSELFGRVEWSDNQTTLHRTSILRDEIPGLLIDFYEKHLAFAETQ
ncbi:predicted protein [Lichtheimia corymbifera JMRC:FSU:9682]|uniref:Chromo domain-containing protein n=1 Tax=Lichtheimia corymbifera JMRC:FSU:9682 TaxID=1263082 RepID=A0A068S323_9FUNG|nr:predicted protein [Lichtheimia corymbifera JMRC:FSU:9682]